MAGVVTGARHGKETLEQHPRQRNRLTLIILFILPRNRFARNARVNADVSAPAFRNSYEIRLFFHETNTRVVGYRFSEFHWASCSLIIGRFVGFEILAKTRNLSRNVVNIDCHKI